MTISEIKDKLSKEREFGSRFPARIIFTESLDAYSLLVSQLKGICDFTYNLADFCLASDTVPQFDRITEKLRDLESKQVLLLSVGEYLRVCIKRELNPQRRQFLSFWERQQSQSSRTRIIMPMFCCRDVFDRVVGIIDDRQQDYVWILDAAPTTEIYTISVYSTKFKGVLVPEAGNLSDWLLNWQEILHKNKSCSIITLLEGYVESSYGTVNIKSISSPFLYLQDLLVDGVLLNEKWGNDEFWSSMVTKSLEFSNKVTFEQIALLALNKNSFDFLSILDSWNSLTTFQKKLVWIWYRIYPNEDYFSYVCNKAESSSDIPSKIRDEILRIPNPSDLWINQRMQALKRLNLNSFDNAYFSLLDKIPSAETKLHFLTYQTHEEKAYAVKVISGLLRNGYAPSTIADMIFDHYPALAVYLNESTGCDAEVDEYMSWYRKNKLINRFPGEYSSSINFERFDSRYKLLHQMKGKDCFEFWIDGFGVEYVPVFLHELRLLGIDVSSVAISTALLPTKSEYNKQWDSSDLMSAKWDQLDTCSHHGFPDDKSFYSCIVHQLDVFVKAAKYVQEQLKDHEYVVITGDHGSSRIAALAFHESCVIPLTAPNKSLVRCFGRFCELDEKSSDIIPLPETTKIKSTIGGKTILAMNNYQHFSVSGNAAGGNTDENDVVGEIHGGNTPEERLVPVIVVRRKTPLPPFTCKPRSLYVTKRNGHIETTLSFNRPVSSLEVSTGANEAFCTKIDDSNWLIAFDNLTSEVFVLTIIANGMLLPKVTLKVKSQGINKNMDIL